MVRVVKPISLLFNISGMYVVDHTRETPPFDEVNAKQEPEVLASAVSSENVRNDMKKVSSSAGLVAPSHVVDCYKDADIKLLNEPKQDSFIENGIWNGNAAQGACSTEVNEPEQDCPHGDDVPAQAASSTKEVTNEEVYYIYHF